MVRLESDRLIVRHYFESDLHDLHNLISDKVNMYFVDDIFSNSIEETAQNLTHVMKNKDGQYFAICNKHSDEFIGSVGYTYTNIDQINGIKVAHLGYFILPKHHSKGYVTEAVKKVLAFAFESDSCTRITTGCYSQHIASERVMIKAGFCKVSECADVKLHDGVFKNKLKYAIDAKDYQNR